MAKESVNVLLSAQWGVAKIARYMGNGKSGVERVRKLCNAESMAGDGYSDVHLEKVLFEYITEDLVTVKTLLFNFTLQINGQREIVEIFIIPSLEFGFTVQVKGIEYGAVSDGLASAIMRILGGSSKRHQG